MKGSLWLWWHRRKTLGRMMRAALHDCTSTAWGWLLLSIGTVLLLSVPMLLLTPGIPVYVRALVTFPLVAGPSAVYYGVKDIVRTGQWQRRYPHLVRKRWVA